MRRVLQNPSILVGANASDEVSVLSMWTVPPPTTMCLPTLLARISQAFFQPSALPAFRSQVCIYRRKWYRG
jgi:hypothetical protein